MQAFYFYLSCLRNDRCEHFILSDLWRCAHEKQKNTCRKTIPSHHGMPSKWIDRSSMVCGTRHQTGNFLQLGKKDCVRKVVWICRRQLDAPIAHQKARKLSELGVSWILDPIPYEQPLNVIPAATERNNFSVAESMKLSVGSFHLTIPNGTDPQLLAQTLRIVKELEC